VTLDTEVIFDCGLVGEDASAIMSAVSMSSSAWSIGILRQVDRCRWLTLQAAPSEIRNYFPTRSTHIRRPVELRSFPTPSWATTRTITATTGAASYDCGIAGEPTKFGGSLGITAGSTNSGVIGPQAFYLPTPVRLTANGGAFGGGAVRVAVHYLMARESVA
jgi:hypothetical protein